MKKLEGKWALVTGASRGVGARIAKALAAEGCKVIIHSRVVGHSKEVLESLGAAGVEAHAVEADLSDQTQVDRMLDVVMSLSPGIDILYNNAAIMSPWRENPWNVPAEDFRTSFETNVISLARICYRLVPGMIGKGWGRVVNLTSGIADQPELTPYALSKAAVDKFTRDFANKLAGTGVMMNLLDPGWLRTDLGGPNAPGDPDSVIPGALVPVLMDDGISGRLFHAQDWAGKPLPEVWPKLNA